MFLHNGIVVLFHSDMPTNNVVLRIKDPPNLGINQCQSVTGIDIAIVAAYDPHSFIGMFGIFWHSEINRPIGWFLEQLVQVCCGAGSD